MTDAGLKASIAEKEAIAAAESQRAHEAEVADQVAQWRKLAMGKEAEAREQQIEHLKARKIDLKNVRDAMKFIFEAQLDSDESKQKVELYYYEFKTRSVRDLQSAISTCKTKIAKYERSVRDAQENVPDLLLKQVSLERLLQMREKKDQNDEALRRKKLRLKKQQEQLANEMKALELASKMEALQNVGGAGGAGSIGFTPRRSKSFDFFDFFDCVVFCFTFF